ncbi:MAG TPA: hypothetical protein VIP09_15460, partial [Dehalococcoidia bacterium]
LAWPPERWLEGMVMAAGMLSAQASPQQTGGSAAGKLDGAVAGPAPGKERARFKRRWMSGRAYSFFAT